MSHNTILLTGTYQVANGNVIYELRIWAQQANNTLQFVRPIKLELPSYDRLWKEVIPIVTRYFNDQSFEHGLHTAYLTHLIPMPYQQERCKHRAQSRIN